MTDSKSLYRVDFERFQTASLWVLAESEEEAREDAAEGLGDLLGADDWWDGSEEVSDISPVSSSAGNQVWSGGPEGDWIDPIT